MMRTTATPAQIEALQRGEPVKLLVRMEPQPYAVFGWPRMPGAYGKDCKTIRCPVAVGNTVDARCDRYDSIGDCVKPGDVLDECPVNGRLCGTKATVRSISHTETDGVHYWVIEVSP